MVRNRQNPNRIRDKAPKRPAMRAAVSIKNPSGTMLMSISVAGSRIHRSLVKNIWWNMTKYLEKSVEMIRARAVSYTHLIIGSQVENVNQNKIIG